MKTLNNLLQEYNIQGYKKNEQPINESVLLMCGLFGALMMGFASIFNSCKDEWYNLPKPSSKDKEKAKQNEENMGDSAKSAFKNFMSELFHKGKNEDISEEIQKMKQELEEAEKKGSKSELSVLKDQAKKIIKWINSEEDKNTSANINYYATVCNKLGKVAKELDDEIGIERGKKLYSEIDSRWSNALLDSDKEEIFRVYFSQIGINAENAWKNNDTAFDSILQLVKNSSKAAKDKLDKDKQDSKDDQQSSDFEMQTMIEYVFKIALAVGPNNDMFNYFLDTNCVDYQMNAIEMLIGSTMIMYAEQHSKEDLEMYQKMFNILNLKISLNGGK